MKRKKSQKRTAKLRKNYAREAKVVKLQEPVTKQPKKYGEVDITLVSFKAPRRNVKPPKKYADRDFIYYNNAGHDDIGIDPVFLCECALDTSAPSISEDKLNTSSETTLTASETEEDVVDLSKLCQTVLITSDPADHLPSDNQSTDIGNDKPVESYDDYIDLSKMCQTELITSDPADAQLEINRVKAGNSEEEFILGLSDGELDFASSLRHSEKEVYQKKPVAKKESLCVKKIEKKENTTVAKRKKRRRRNSWTRKRRKVVKEKVQVQDSETNIPTKSKAISVKNNCTENNKSKEVPLAKPEDNHQRFDETVHLARPTADPISLGGEQFCPENILDKELTLTNPHADQSTLDKENVCPENILDKEVPVANPNSGQSLQDEENVCPENTLDEVLVAKHNTDQSLLDEENVCPKNNLNEILVAKHNTDQSISCAENVYLENTFDEQLPVAKHCNLGQENVPKNILDKEVLITKPNADHSDLDKVKVSPESILDKEVLLEAGLNAEHSPPNEKKVCLDNALKEKVCTEKIIDKEVVPVAKINAPDEENVCPENIFDKEVPVLEPNVGYSPPDKESGNSENILEKEAVVLNPDPGKEDNLNTHSDKEKLSKEKFKELKPVEKNLEECSVPDTDSGCDVEMEQCCEEDEHVNMADPVEKEETVSKQVPYFNDTRIVKVLLRRLEDEEYFNVWKEDNQLPQSGVLDDSTLQPSIDNSNPKASTVIKKKHKRSRNIWDTKIKKMKFVRCTNCDKKFPNEFTMKKHRGSHTCILLVGCRICFNKFKSVDRLLEHIKSNCDTERVFVCNDCGKGYALKQNLEKHQDPICKTLKSKKCDVCDKQFSSRITLQRHLEVHGKGPLLKSYLCEVCGALVAPRDSQSHMEKHMENFTIICKTCGKEFKSRYKFKMHMKMHSIRGSNKGKQFTCAECGKSFSTLNLLTAHLSKHGMMTSAEKLESKSFNETYVCSKCTKLFKTHQDLKDHISVCSVQLKIKKEENLSMKEEKPHICHICGKAFGKSVHLKQHSVVHLKQTTSISLICDMCGKKFKSSFHLSQHKRMVSCDVSTTNYFCRVCGKECEDFPSLKMHFIETHEVKPSLKCDKCGKEFDSKPKLRSHSKTHSEGYWTTCMHCAKVITKRSLSNHIAVVHKSLSESANITSEVKIEPIIKVEEQPNLSSVNGSLSTCSRLSESTKPKLVLNNYSEKNLLPCRFCGRILGSRQSLKRHVLHVHKSSSLTESSSTSLISKAELPFIKIEETAAVKEENEIIPSIEIPIPVNKQINDRLEKNGLSCGICGKVLAHSRSLRRHMFSVHKLLTGSTTSQVVPKMEGYNINAQPQLTLNNENVFLSERHANEFEARELPSSGSVNSQLSSMAEQQISMATSSLQISPGRNSESYGSFNCDVDTSSQTEQQVPEAPTISCLSQSDYQSSELSNANILMSQMINAQNYKMYLPNTSFVNSQNQNVQTSSRIESPTKRNDIRSHELIRSTQPQQPQQNHYPLLESTSAAYLIHEDATSNIHSQSIPDFSADSAKVSPSNQYPNSESNSNITTTSLLEDKQLKMIDNIVCTPPPVQTLDSALLNITMEQPLTPNYNNTQQLRGSIQTAPSISYNYFIAPGSNDYSDTLLHGSNLTTQTTGALCYQSSQTPEINFKIIHQNNPVVTSTNTYLVHQYVNPKPAQATPVACYQSPEVSNTFILIEPTVEPESPGTSKTIVSSPVRPSNQFIQKVDTRSINQYKIEPFSKKSNVICNLCKDIFPSKEDLNRHLPAHGLEVTSTHYRCMTCGQTFDLKYKYRADEHLRKHTGEKPFSCKLCSEKFRTNTLLHKHVLAHSKVPIQCSVCKVPLSSTYSLRRHLRAVHKIDTPPMTYQPPEPVKTETPAKSFLENELSSFIAEEEEAPIQRELAEPQPNFHQSVLSHEISHFNGSEQVTPSNAYSYRIEESNSIHSDIALDLSDLRDDFVPDSMETVLKLENW